MITEYWWADHIPECVNKFSIEKAGDKYILSGFNRVNNHLVYSLASSDSYEELQVWADLRNIKISK